jgi:hypothetical protein
MVNQTLSFLWCVWGREKKRAKLQGGLQVEKFVTHLVLWLPENYLSRVRCHNSFGCSFKKKLQLVSEPLTQSKTCNRHPRPPALKRTEPKPACGGRSCFRTHDLLTGNSNDGVGCQCCLCAATKSSFPSFNVVTLSLSLPFPWPEVPRSCPRVAEPSGSFSLHAGDPCLSLPPASVLFRVRPPSWLPQHSSVEDKAQPGLMAW